MKAEAFVELKRGVYTALETYSNVHRGSGVNSMVTTHLYEQARDIVLEYLGLDKDKFTVIFSTPRRAEALKAQLKLKIWRLLVFCTTTNWRNTLDENCLISSGKP